MRSSRATRTGNTLLRLILPLGVVVTTPVLADYGLVDEQSLRNGAQLYQVFCSDCHGSDSANQFGQLYAPDAPSAVDEEYDKLIDIVQQQESAQLIAVPETDDEWPEWAERPDPGAEQPLDEKTEVMNTFSALIDEAHGITSTTAPQDSDDAAIALSGQRPVTEGPPGGFEPVPGATNLADPASYYHGTSEEEVFDSIADGTGEAMPGFRTELGGDEAIQDVVNYIRSFWGEEWLY